MKTEEFASIRLPARFRILRELGRGGMGVVYEVDDQQLGIHVALKTLTRTTAQYLLRLKSEFRTLAGLSHSNLACLHELMEFEGQWFFTMELIGGAPFPEWVRGAKVSAASQEFTRTTTSTSVASDESWRPSLIRSPALRDVEAFERLRNGAVQLATALEWMHGRGVLHRDIKGSNVLVTPEGRVVLLDFGLALQMSGKAPQGYAGTPAYMAPERFRNAVPVPAEDWYSLGALFFETITGQHASTGIRTRESRVPSVQALVPDAPPDLALLTDELLQADPALRPSGQEILTRLLGPAALAEPLSKALGPSVFARQEELDAVRSALSRVSEGRAVATVVHGRSGMGKSSLAEELLSNLPSDFLVLRGRCFEQESVPYKAFDGIVDNLAEELGRMRPEEVSAVLPRDARTLAVLFPILLDVTEFGQLPRRAQVGLTAFDVKRRGTQALREMLQRLGDRLNVILYADDFQWADADSRQLLANLLSPPSPPAVMLLMTCREEEGAHESLLKFLSDVSGATDELEVVDIGLEPLNPQRSEHLARELFREADMEASPEKLERIVQESGGNPYLLSELVAWERSGQENLSAAVTLDSFLWRSIQELPPLSRRLLELLSVCVRPIRLRDIFAAASASGIDPAWTAPLRANRLMKGAVTEPDGLVTVWHDRVRETAVSRMGTAERELAHRAIADVLERSPDTDPETLAFHWHGCLQRERACHYYRLAAQRAAAALAFEHAATLFRTAYDLFEGEAAEKRALRTQLAEALADAGQPLTSARLFLQSAGEAEGSEAIDLRRRAAYQFCIGGHMARGRAEMLSVLRIEKVRLPTSESQAMRWLMWSHVRLLLRGYRFTRREPDQIPTSDLRLVDFTWSAATALYMVDMVFGAELLARNALQSLRCGEPTRVARSIAWNASMLAVSGTPMEKRVWRLVGIAEDLAAETGDPHALGMARLARGTSCFSLGYFSRAIEPLEQAQSIFTEQCPGARWETGITNTVMMWALTWMGRYSKAWPLVQRVHREARERNNLLESANVVAATYYASLLILDRPEEAMEVLASVREDWSQEPTTLPMIMASNAEAITLRYMERYTESAARMQVTREQSERAGLLRSQWLRGSLASHMALTAVSRLLEEHPGDHKRVALRLARQLENENRPWGTGYAAQVRAAVLTVEGRYEGALSEVLKARDAFRECGMLMWVDMLTYRAGQITGGDGGREMCSAAEAAIRSELGVNLPKLLNFFTPMRIR